MGPFKSKKTFNNSYGFTLIEVLIAITVLAFISLSTYKMLDSNIETKETVSKEDARILQTITAVSRIDSDVSQFYTPLFFSSKELSKPASGSNAYEENRYQNNSFDGKTRSGAIIPQVKSEDKSTLVFFTQAHRRKIANTKESRYAWIKYSLKPMEADPENPDDKSSGRFELVRQTIATELYVADLDWDNVKPQVLMDNIKELEFLFWNERAKRFTSSLQELNENKFLLRSIQLKMTWFDIDDNEQKIEKIFRVLNPYFNTKEDDLKKNVNTYNNQNSSNTNNTTIQDGEEDEEDESED